MFKQPPAEKLETSFTANGITSAWVPVDRSIWGYFCTEEQGKMLLAKVTPLASDAQLLDGLGYDLFVPVRYLDDTTKMWVIVGTLPNGAVINEYAGKLYDRMLRPNPADGSNWGPNLAAIPLFPDLAQLQWVK